MEPRVNARPTVNICENSKWTSMGRTVVQFHVSEDPLGSGFASEETEAVPALKSYDRSGKHPAYISR